MSFTTPLGWVASTPTWILGYWIWEQGWMLAVAFVCGVVATLTAWAQARATWHALELARMPGTATLEDTPEGPK